jgi:hypothetical protein
MKIISIQGLSGIPDSIQDRVRQRIEEAEARGETVIMRDYDGDWIEHIKRNGEWSVRLA